MIRPPVVCVDFDGTLVHNAYPETGSPIEGSAEALLRLRKMGFYIIIFSCRTNISLCLNEREMFRQKKLIEKSLKDYGIPFDEVALSSTGKPIADFYIDDRAVPFSGDWNTALEYISKNSRPESHRI